VSPGEEIEVTALWDIRGRRGRTRDLHLCLSAVDAQPPDEFLVGTEVFSPEADGAAAAVEVP
jgi:hypothetical protein